MGILIRYLPLLVLMSSMAITQVTQARESVLVVANSGESSLQLSKSELRNLFMGALLMGCHQ